MNKKKLELKSIWKNRLQLRAEAVKRREMFKRTEENKIICDFCGKDNSEKGLSVECFSAWQRMFIQGVDKNSGTLQYRKHDLLSDIKHLCPQCAELIYDLMERKHYWVKICQKQLKGELVERREMMYPNGKKAMRIYYGREGECMQEAKTNDVYRKEILYEEQNLGEYGIGWFVVYENGIETSRHNIKHIETIQWDNALK